MAQIEPMDVDDIVCEFDDKENSLQNSNVLPRTPCTEKGYEELDVSELNMKLQYSITSGSTPMSRSYTNKENKLFNQDDCMNMENDSSNLTKSISSTLTKCETKPLKLPLQAIPNDFVESNLATSVRRSLGTDQNNCTITVDESDNIDDHLLPSTSSSSVQTPEATTPTKDIAKDGGSPILRGLKSVLNLFRTSQGPPPEESLNKNKTIEPLDTILASTPLINKNKENTSRRNSPLKESLVFSDDLEKELQWKDDSTIIFKHEKIPIHKLFYNQAVEDKITKKIMENLDSTVEKMDISYNDSMVVDKTMTEISSNISSGVRINCVESDGEFVDCEAFTSNIDQTGPEINQTAVIHSEAIDNQTKNEPNVEYERRPAVDELMSGTIEENASAQLNKDSNEIETKNVENELTPIVQSIESMFGINEKDLKNNESNDKPTINYGFISNIENELSYIVQDIEAMPGAIKKTASSTNEKGNKEQHKNDEFESNTKNELGPIVVDADSISGTVDESGTTLKKDKNENQSKNGEYKSIKNEPMLNDLESISGNVEIAVTPINREIYENQIRIDQSSNEYVVSPIVQETELEFDNIEKTYLNQKLTAEISGHKMKNTDDNLITNNNSVSSNINFIGIVQDTTAVTTDLNSSIQSSTDMEPSIENVIEMPTNETLMGILTCGDKDEKMESEKILGCSNTDEKMEAESKTSLNLEVTDEKELEIDNMLATISHTIEKEENIIKDLDTTLLQKSSENDNNVNLTLGIDNMNTTIVTEVVNHANALVDLQNCNNIISTYLGNMESVDSNDNSTHNISEVINHANALVDLQNCNNIISTYLGNMESVDSNDNSTHNISNIELVIENKFEESPNKISKIEIQNNVPDCALEIMSDVSELELQCKLLNNLEINNKQSHEANISLTNKSEGNKIVDLKKNKAELQESLSNESNKDAPSDVPLPVDEDIEKDSLMDSLIITNEDTENSMSKVTEPSQNIDIPMNDTLSALTCPLQVSINSIETPLTKISETLTTNEMYSNLNENENRIDQSEIKCDIIENNVKDSFVNDKPIENRTHIQIHQIPQTLIDTNNEILHQQNESELCLLENCFPVTDNSIEISTMVKSESSDNLNLFDDGSVKTQNIMHTATNSSLEKLHPLNANLEVIFGEESSVSTAKKTTIDEECIASKNILPADFRTPYNDCDLNKEQYKATGCEKIERESLALPPTSPKLSSKGYNFNFDNIDDPFATKTNLRLSPPLHSSTVYSDTSVNQREADLKRQQMQDRRKSQPVKKIRNISKKRFNNSFDSALGKNGDEISTIINSEAKSNMKTNDISLDDKNFIPIKDSYDVKIQLSTPEKVTPVEFEITEDKSENKQKEVIQETIQSNEENITNTNLIVENVATKNVFNLPEIDDIHFNPFFSKSKLRQSPPPIFDSNITITLEADANFQADKAISPNTSTVTCSSKDTDDKDNTVREVNTEDEDTIEGPFFDADVLADIDKLSDDGLKTGTQYEDFPVQNDDNKNDGELFIDAEAFEFLLNRNTNNVVLDSGKESLFLKFDPLLAKRVSSDGVLADLDKVQRKQSTPKKPVKETIKDDTEPTTAPRTSIIFTTLTEETQEESNAATSKPMMVVSPAVSSLVSPRKSTPPRINRRSLTFPSPAMVVIDRLLSLSGNTSILEQDVTMSPPSRQYSETDIALAQLRDLLEEKHIEVQNLKSETEELNIRLCSMESQIRSLEKDRDDHVNKMNDLNESLAQKTKMNITMRGAVEEYEKTIATLIAKLNDDKRRNAEERARIISERDEQTAHLANMETTFSDLHSKYEKSKQVILNMKSNEDILLKSHEKLQNSCEKLHQNYELLKQHASSKLNHVNQELDGINKAHQAEVLRLNAQVKRKDLETKSLEESLLQKTKANEELTAICDELINNRLN